MIGRLTVSQHGAQISEYVQSLGFSLVEFSTYKLEHVYIYIYMYCILTEPVYFVHNNLVSQMLICMLFRKKEGNKRSPSNNKIYNGSDSSPVPRVSFVLDFSTSEDPIRSATVNSCLFCFR